MYLTTWVLVATYRAEWQLDIVIRSFGLAA